MKNKKYFLITFVLLIALQYACVKKPDVLPQQVTDDRPLTTILKNNYTFSMFYSALLRTGLDKTLQDKGPFTVLAPDNDAFSNSGISADSLAKIDTATLKKLLLYHIIPASIPYSAIPNTIDVTYKTLAGPDVYFSQPSGAQNPNYIVLHINGATVNKTDIAASNGYIIAISKVLYYPAVSVKSYLENNPQYSYFVQGLKQFGMWDQLDKPGPFVVMAPSNDMFIQNGIDKTALAALDTLTYKKSLFSPYILSRYFFFISDFSDAPLPSNGFLPPLPGIINPDYVQVVTTDGYGLWSPNWEFIQQVNWAPPYYGYQYIYAPEASFTDPNHQAVNGIVHGIGGLVMLPDSVKIHP